MLQGNLLAAQYLEGQGDVVRRLIMGINRVTTWVVGVINLLICEVPLTLQVASGGMDNGWTLEDSWLKAWGLAKGTGRLLSCLRFRVLRNTVERRRKLKLLQRSRVRNFGCLVEKGRRGKDNNNSCLASFIGTPVSPHIC